jgi:hypothetical protein
MDDRKTGLSLRLTSAPAALCRINEMDVLIANISDGT